MALFGLFHWFNRQVSNHPMPHQLEGYAMAHRTGRAPSLATHAAIFGGVVGAPMALGAALLRYGGLRAYRRALPLFLGLVLGEFIVGSDWQLWAAATNTSAYVFWL